MAGVFGPQRWTGAMREAFLRGLAAHGEVKRACRENGISPSTAYDLRRRDGDFARLWEQVLTRYRAERAAQVKAAAAKRRRRDGYFPGYRPRINGWTELRTRIFLRALAETGCVRDACKRARITDNSAYKMRRRDPKFAEAWEKALDETIPTLEQAAWERAVEGWDEIVWKDGVEVSRKRRYSDALLKFLLSRGEAGQPPKDARPEELVRLAHAAARAAGGIFATRASEEETNAAILEKLAMIDKARAMEAEEAAREAAEAAADGEDARDWAAPEGAPRPPPPAAMPRITGCP